MSDLPGPRCGQYVEGGGITSYPCMLESGHQGPCVAIELPVSTNRRNVWLEQQAKQRQPSIPVSPQAPSSPVAGVPSPPATLSPALLADPFDRERQQLERLGIHAIEGLPNSHRALAISEAAQTSLGVFYQLARQQFDAGADTVVVTKPFLDRLLTPAVKAFFDQFFLSLPPESKE